MVVLVSPEAQEEVPQHGMEVLGVLLLVVRDMRGAVFLIMDRPMRQAVAAVLVPPVVQLQAVAAVPGVQEVRGTNG
jgi:hypothetical protein